MDSKKLNKLISLLYACPHDVAERGCALNKYRNKIKPEGYHEFITIQSPRFINDIIAKHTECYNLRKLSGLQSKFNVLTRREREIVCCVGKYTDNIEITRQLKITMNTLRQHLKNIYSKLSVRGRLGLQRFISKNEV